MGENKLANENTSYIWTWENGEEIQHIQDVYNPFDVLLKPTQQKPYIGLIVHYYDHYHHQRAAIVTAIHRESDEVDLFVLYPTRQDSIQHVKHDSDHEKETWDFIG